jgi:hypothetical protein
MKQLFLLSVSLLAISACVPQSAPPPPAAVAAPYAVGSAANTTTASMEITVPLPSGK